jgi:hypothetical protein
MMWLCGLIYGRQGFNSEKAEILRVKRRGTRNDILSK